MTAVIRPKLPLTKAQPGDETGVLPARILLQIRDGVPNLLHEFELKTQVEGSRELDADDPDRELGATKSHSVSISSEIIGLFETIVTLGENYANADSDNPEHAAQVVEWLYLMGVWAADNVESQVKA